MSRALESWAKVLVCFCWVCTTIRAQGSVGADLWANSHTIAKVVEQLSGGPPNTFGILLKIYRFLRSEYFKTYYIIVSETSHSSEYNNWLSRLLLCHTRAIPELIVKLFQSDSIVKPLHTSPIPVPYQSQNRYFIVLSGGYGNSIYWARVEVVFELGQTAIDREHQMLLLFLFW